jgi:hypothetical protein
MQLTRAVCAQVGVLDGFAGDGDGDVFDMEMSGHYIFATKYL